MKTLKNLESFGGINKTYFVNCILKMALPHQVQQAHGYWKVKITEIAISENVI